VSPMQWKSYLNHIRYRTCHPVFGGAFRLTPAMQEELASFIFAENLRAEELAHDQGRILHVPQKSRYWERFMSSRCCCCGSLTPREDQVIAQMKEGTAGITRPLPEIVAACLSIAPNTSDALQHQQRELTPASFLMRSKQGRALLKQQYRSGLRRGNDFDAAARTASSPVTVASVVGSPAPACVPASSAPTIAPSTTVSATTAVLRSSSSPLATPVPRLLTSARSIAAPARVPPRHASALLPLPPAVLKASRNTDSFFQRAVQCPYIAWDRNSCSVDSIDWVLHVAFMYLADQKGFSRHSNSSISVSQEFFESVQNNQFPVSMNILLQHSNSLLSYVQSSSSSASSSLRIQGTKS
jgi:hypothetical protein